jgi:lipopolysaccharide biosynthesis glycosyltransferase
MTSSIYVAYHKPSSLIESTSICPIHVGRASSGKPLHGMIGDDSGDNISAKNSSYCELTALYWAWKNDRTSEKIGLMHYRRLLDFSDSYSARHVELKLASLRVSDYTSQTEAWLAANPDVDLVLPKPHIMPITVRVNYSNAHRASDLEVVEKYVDENYPAYSGHLKSVLEGRKIYLANMFLAKRPILDQYCEFLFDVLEQVDQANIDRKYYSTYQSRFLGFISERLFTAFISKYLEDNPSCKVKYVHILNLAEASCTPHIADDSLNGSESVNIAFSADDKYLPHAAAMVVSAMEHFSPDRVYNLFLLYSDIAHHRIEMFSGLIQAHPNVRLHTLNIGDPFRNSYRPTTPSPSTATYNRFMLFELLPTTKRILYVDCDMIMRGDLAEIFDVEMGDHKIAAVPDFIMTRTLTNKVKTLDKNIPDLYAYQREKLGLEDHHIYNYFNAGLILFNFAAMDVASIGKELIERAKTSRFFFQDQDLLNCYFKDSYLRLPAKYNVFNSNDATYTHVPAGNQKEALAAKKHPFVIHYAAAAYKPWEIAEVHYSQFYWNALMKTPFFMEVVDEAKRARGDSGVFSHGYWLKLGRKVAKRYPRLAPILYRTYVRFFRRN